MPQPSPQAPPRAQALPHAHICTSSPLFRHFLYGPDLRDAYAHARRLGLGTDDAEDCAMDFLLHKLTHAKSFHQDAALRRRCARAFAVDARRSLTRRAQHEVSPADLHGPNAPDRGRDVWEADSARECAEAGPASEQALLSVTLMALLLSLLDRLRPAAAHLMRRHHLDGESVAELAAASSQTPHAVEQALFRSRRRLRHLLEAEGLNAFDLL